jgi:hypothetical protein
MNAELNRFASKRKRKSPSELQRLLGVGRRRTEISQQPDTGCDYGND